MTALKKQIITRIFSLILTCILANNAYAQTDCDGWEWHNEQDPSHVGLNQRILESNLLNQATNSRKFKNEAQVLCSYSKIAYSQALLTKLYAKGTPEYIERIYWCNRYLGEYLAKRAMSLSEPNDLSYNDWLKLNDKNDAFHRNLKAIELSIYTIEQSANLCLNQS